MNMKDQLGQSSSTPLSHSLPLEVMISQSEYGTTNPRNAYLFSEVT